MKTIITTTFIIFHLMGYGQNSPNQLLSEKGIQLLPSSELNEQQFESILSFDFEPYRENHTPVVAYLANGIQIEIYSKAKVEYLKSPKRESTLEEDSKKAEFIKRAKGMSTTVDLPPNEYPVRKVKVIQLDMEQTTNQ